MSYYHDPGDYTAGFPYRPGDSWIAGKTPGPPPPARPSPAPRHPRAPTPLPTGQEQLAGLMGFQAGLLQAVGAVSSVYHGYKRSRGNPGWTMAWALFGAVLPVAAIPVALAQGFGEPKKRKGAK